MKLVFDSQRKFSLNVVFLVLCHTVILKTTTKLCQSNWLIIIIIIIIINNNFINFYCAIININFQLRKFSINPGLLLKLHVPLFIVILL